MNSGRASASSRTNGARCITSTRRREGPRPARAAGGFNSQPWFYDTGDFIFRLAELQGAVKCVVFARYYARARASMRTKGTFVAADVDVPPPSAWTCLTKNA